MVARHTLDQSRRNSDDLAAIKTRLDRVEQNLDGLRHDVDGLRHDFNGLKKDLPQIVSDTMREVLREHDRER